MGGCAPLSICFWRTARRREENTETQDGGARYKVDASRLKAASIFALLPSWRRLCPSLVQPSACELWAPNTSSGGPPSPEPRRRPLLCALSLPGLQVYLPTPSFSLLRSCLSSLCRSFLLFLCLILSVCLAVTHAQCFHAHMCALALFFPPSLPPSLCMAHFVCPPHPPLSSSPSLSLQPTLQCLCRQLHVCSQR